LYSEDKFLHGGFPAIAVPELAGDRNALEKWIQPVSAPATEKASRPNLNAGGQKDVALTFRTVGAGRPGDVTLSPFYRLFSQRYCVYWRFRPAVEA
ncbi:MAG: hypothetical protein WBF26_09620, partial [Candidatus Sulfotelmatobacter sp.]